MAGNLHIDRNEGYNDSDDYQNDYLEDRIIVDDQVV